MVKFYYMVSNHDRNPYFYNIQNGGKLIGEGKYGCVYRPSLKDSDYNIITKVFYVENENINPETNIPYDIEFDQRLNTIDPNGKYHYKLLNFSNLPSDYHLLDCKILSKPNVEFFISEYEYAGITLSFANLETDDNPPSFFNPISARQILFGFKNIYKIILFLYRHNLSHNDIHIGNIVINEIDYSLKLIDFMYMNFSLENVKFDLESLLSVIEDYCNFCKNYFKHIENEKDYYNCVIINCISKYRKQFSMDINNKNIEYLINLGIEFIDECKK